MVGVSVIEVAVIYSFVIPALGAGIHALEFEDRKAWIPGPSPGMTELNARTE
jgi:hypothetical protein